MIDTNFTCPVKIHLDFDSSDEYAAIPFAPSYGFVTILAKKIADIDSDVIRFEVELEEVLGKESVYPKWHGDTF